MSASQFPPLQGKPSSKHCTNCSSKMTLYALPGHYDSTVEIDVCMDCSAIWFDHFESMALSPDGTVALFQLIHERGGTATSAATKFGEGLRCVTCGVGMRLTNDQVRGTRFAYQACPKGHGRLTTFYNFLAEKQFVRELTKPERAKLAATVQQVRCSGCGAAVNIGRVDACEYCRAPVAVFDREAAKKAIDHYLLQRQIQPSSNSGDRRTGGRLSSEQWSTYERADLGTDILFALGRAAVRGLSPAGRIAGAGAAGAAGVATEVFADSGAAAVALPDATSVLFGSDLAASVSGSAASVASDAALSLTGGAGGALSEALPSATDALFGAVSSGAGDAAAALSGELGGEISGALGEAAVSGVGEVAAGVAADLGSGTLEAAGDVASSMGEGVVDLVADGIGSLLGTLFS